LLERAWRGKTAGAHGEREREREWQKLKLQKLASRLAKSESEPSDSF